MDFERIIRSLADPTRLRIMRLLARMELAVGELAQALRPKPTACVAPCGDLVRRGAGGAAA